MIVQWKDSRHREGALTRIDVLVIIVVILLLGALGLHWHRVFWSKAARIACVVDLKNIELAFRVFATDNEHHFPMELSLTRKGTKELTGDPTLIWMHFAALSNQLGTPTLLVCPADKMGRIGAITFSRAFRDKQTAVFSQNANLSYFVGLDTTERNPMMLLAGDRNLTNDGPAQFAYGVARVGNLGTNHTGRIGAAWDRNVHRAAGNVVLSDGSVQQVTTSRLRELLRSSGDANNRVAVPD